MNLENLKRTVELANSLNWEEGYYAEIRNGCVHMGRDPNLRVEVF